MTEVLLRQLSEGRVDAVSAGSAPKKTIHPAAKATSNEVCDRLH